jgi:3-oxoacyl-[acyl-carrier-protein] synthase-3
MNSIKIVASGMYLPGKGIDNSFFNDKFKLDEDWIFKRTGINKRYWTDSESTSEMSIKAVKNLIETNDNVNLNNIGLIIVASTSFETTMPGISFEIQKEFNIDKCMCMDISAGCGGYINALDIARNYIELGEIKSALVIGAERLSKYIDKEDINTVILLGDGAGATLIEKSENKLYAKSIESIGKEGNILTCKENQKIYMDGKKIYKFGTIKVSDNINQLLKRENINIQDIKYIIPHQSNLRMMQSMADKIEAKKEQMYINISEVGNTFNASIPIALNQVIKNKLIKEKDKIMLVGYGGGLNLGSILIEI